MAEPVTIPPVDPAIGSSPDSPKEPSEESQPQPRDPQDQLEQQTLIAKWLPGLNSDLENLFGPTVRDGSIHTLAGLLKGFLLYFVPVSLLKRTLKGHLRRAAAFALFVGSIRLIARILRRVSRKFIAPEGDPALPFQKYAQLVRKYHLGIAGGIGGLLAVLVDGNLHKSSIVLFWCLVRASRTFLPEVPYGSVIMMCLTAGQILATWIARPKDVDPSYLKFLDLHGGKPKETVRFIGSHRHADPCQYSHPNQSHLMAGLHYWPASFKRSIKVYLPVYLVFFLFSKKRSLQHFLENLIRSTAFLATYCTLGWSSACVYYQLFNTGTSRANLFAHTWSAGLAVLLERPGRRAELAAYCTTYALDTIYRTLLRRGAIVARPVVNLFLLAFAAAVMLHNHKQQPAILMKWLFKIM